MKRKLPFLLTIIIILVTSVITGTGLLTFAYSIPTEAMRDNLISSADTLISEGSYPNAYSWCVSELDNLTDGLMVSIAGYKSESPAIVDAMEGCSYAIDGYASEYAMRNHYVYGANPFEKISPYTRYWHGYLVFLKPLLALADYSVIRIINLILQTGLAVAAAVLMYKNLLRKYILPFVLSLLIIGPQVIFKSLQFSTCYYTLLLGSIAALILIKRNAGNRGFFILFFIIGIFTSFIDFLTYPVSTFGVPAVIVMNASENRTCRESTGRVLKLLLLWLCGYSLMWLCKFPLACVLSSREVLSDAAQETITWMVTARGFTNVFYMLYRNIRSFALTPFIIPAIVFAVICIVRALKNRKISLNYTAQLSLPYLIIAFVPFAWYFVMAAPSYIHDFFTSKALVVTAFSMLSLCARINVKKD